MKHLTRQEFYELIRKQNINELNYMMGRFGGPYNVILREKTYGYEIGKILTDAVAEEIASRAFDSILLGNDE